MVKIINPFITSGYVSGEYFCDRDRETKELLRLITNGNNVALISTRRMGKTGLIQHCFDNKTIKKDYNTFFVDIYATRCLDDFVMSLGKVILERLKPLGRKALESFVDTVKSLSAGISFDVSGNPSLNFQAGRTYKSERTLEEIFKYIENAGKPCIVAIDEFQQIADYPEKNVEAILRTHVQHCSNSRFIFSGSRRHVIGNMFLSPSRPFYQSVSMLDLEPIAIEKYTEFALYHFNKRAKKIPSEFVEEIYERFDGITWYVQKMLNAVFTLTEPGCECKAGIVDLAQDNIVESYNYNYQETIYRLPDKQKNLLVAIAKEGKAKAVTGGRFISKYSLTGSSSVQSALKGLLEKDFVTSQQGVYYIYDRFFAIWLRKNINLSNFGQL